jgi:hypothetical protein
MPKDSTSAIDRILGTPWIFDGVRRVIANKAHLRRAWISSRRGETCMDCAAGIYPTKITYRHPGVTDSLYVLVVFPPSASDIHMKQQAGH